MLYYKLRYKSFDKQMRYLAGAGGQKEHAYRIEER
jgi:hypothetical protein